MLRTIKLCNLTPWHRFYLQTRSCSFQSQYCTSVVMFSHAHYDATNHNNNNSYRCYHATPSSCRLSQINKTQHLTIRSSSTCRSTEEASVGWMAFLKRVFNSKNNSEDPQPESGKMNGEVDNLAENTDKLTVNDTSDEAQFGCAPGVLRTRVGFAGGSKKGPTYHSLGDHTETVEICFDPKQTSYEEMLKIFWENHDPTRCASTQYMSAIFYNNEEQKKLAVASKEAEQKRRARNIQTRVDKAGPFYNAEDYHQKYLLRQQRDVVHSLGLTDQELITSTVACRLNGYCGGYGTVTALEQELPPMNLPLKVQERVKRLAARGPN